MKIITWVKNFFFCLKYPFWTLRNVWDGKFIGYSSTWYDSIPEGWQKAFGKQLSQDIKKAGKATRKRLKKHVSWRKMLSFQQIKEKWGELCLYASASREIREVLDYYEYLSLGYCIYCGKPARYKTRGWVTYVCEECYDRKSLIVDEALKKENRLNKQDIPKLTILKDSDWVDISLKDKYGIDLEDLWGL